MIPTKGHLKSYHWGKIGDDSHIAKFLAVAKQNSSLAKSDHQDGQKEGARHFAELWFGSHPSGPSSIAIGQNSITLDKFLAKEPEMIGVVDHYFKYNKQLSYLFKILSVAQPLSLQAHPDKERARVLHKRDPKNYPDANHKPELAIALTDFHVLCDFRPHREIAEYISKLEPLRHIIGAGAADRYVNLVKHHEQDHSSLRTNLGECFKHLMIQGTETLLKHTLELINNQPKELDSGLFSLIKRLHSLYPGDPGVWAPFFLNYFKLSPGQAIYLKPNKLHAYLSGECIECMACSDNVVRAGLTTKFRDVATLIEMSDYTPVKDQEDLKLTATRKVVDGCEFDLYAPTDEFKVEKITIGDKGQFVLPSVKSGSFVLVMNGKASAPDFFDLKMRHNLGFGFACYVPPKVSVNLTDIQGALVMYRAFC